MPKKMHENLKKRAKKKGLKKGSEAYNKYVYGTMQEHKKKRGK